MPGQHGVEPRGLESSKDRRDQEGRFGFIFKKLPAFAPPDDLLIGLANTMREPQEVPAEQTDNPDIPAGFTFLAQFLDHDLTLDRTPLDEQQRDPGGIENFRSARFELDSVYGRGPAETPELYDPNDRDKLLIAGLGDPNRPDDLPRGGDGRAIIGDSRNDENLIVCQLHVAFLKFHNAVVDRVRAQGSAPGTVFEEARRLTRWHYQWMVVHDFLPRVIGRDLLDRLLEERDGQPAKVRLDFYKPRNPNRPMMPVEFSVAAYRFGHSMVRPGYRMNAAAGGLFFGPTPTDRNLNGGRPIPPNLVVEWHNFFDLPGRPAPQPARRIDSRLSLPLFTLPASVVPPPDPRVSLAERNLLRGKRLALPSGQRVAREMGVPALSNAQLGLGDEAGWGGEAPLWYYMLKEAELGQGGRRLGPVGGRIVGEVFVGLIERDQESYLRRDPRFRPAPPLAPVPGRFTMGDLLAFAGVV